MARHIRNGLAFLIPITSMAWAVSLMPRLGLLVFPEQVLAFVLALAMAVVFLDSENNSSASLNILLAAAY